MLFDGWRGTSSYGDVAIDSIFINRLGNPNSEPGPEKTGLPFICDFEVHFTQLNECVAV